ncbi:enoyl-CoA hydratase/isomerase family protein [Sinomonas terrae]|uniref:Enoyl-CoA hydratase/isomerase family protein n=1 Tax=Sinomonas terrae TaxID=2908838 RepID=A0ABS9TWU6_9MICC|nr:enoyl-CoA hydratase/isomerase family protein [Sinomonas terrae]MCH6468904.1 enoyl-CoA hydratase/isomerase family protein [Sinomonas terrae]
MPAEDTGTVGVTRQGEIAVVTLRRERKRNALSTGLEAQLAEQLASEAVATSRVVVITGGDQVFSAGADITELREMTPEAISAYYRSSGAVYEQLASLPMPTIAAIAGYCLGGGLELALAADFRVADDTAVFGFPEIGLGILPSSGGVARAVRTIGPARTRDLILRGRRFDPALAEQWGLITETVSAGTHLKRALQIADELLQAPPLALTLTSQVIDAAAESSHHTALLLEQLAYAVLNRTS